MPLWAALVSLGGVVVGGIIAGLFTMRNVNAQIRNERQITLDQFAENHVAHIREDFQHRLELFSGAFEKHREDDAEFRREIQKDIGDLKSDIARIEGRMNGR